MLSNSYAISSGILSPLGEYGIVCALKDLQTNDEPGQLKRTLQYAVINVVRGQGQTSAFKEARGKVISLPGTHHWYFLSCCGGEGGRQQ